MGGNTLQNDQNAEISPDVHRSQADINDDTYYRFDALIRISSQAKGLAWAFLTLGVLLFIMVTYFYIRDWISFNIQVMYGFLLGLIPALICAFLFVALQGASEIILLFMDIEQNTRAKGKHDEVD